MWKVQKTHIIGSYFFLPFIFQNRLIDFLLLRKDSKKVILNVCRQGKIISPFAITTEHPQNIDDVRIFGDKHEEATVHFQWWRTLHFLQKHTFESYLIFIPIISLWNDTRETCVRWRMNIYIDVCVVLHVLPLPKNKTTTKQQKKLLWKRPSLCNKNEHLHIYN